ncbi:uracil-DNA glycosylase family protein [Stappia sp. F7233]|uniref:Uracil-DNA glycosylase family protein n=1 Tax=Stappia albiluteola TaxID=2758565 RepID=A0A839ABU1_9HYPH|nr:uracil-DNA glycosylase family protein [Stappia albiluteola]MBA5776595.1 uracil-DNA glycosylase family protein [Stappia albiluteola]
MSASRGNGVLFAGRSVEAIAVELSGCRHCADSVAVAQRLPHEPRPVCVLSQTARIAICGQAPGTRVHESGRPYTDPSGDRLRDWMGIGKDVFYDPAKVAIVPMGFCFPGLDAKGGDKPPRRECRALWHDRLFAVMPQLELKLAIGQYAIDYHLRDLRRASVRETVADWREVVAESLARDGVATLPMPHPSWRNNAWLKANPWFEESVLPFLKAEVARMIV